MLFPKNVSQIPVLPLFLASLGAISLALPASAAGIKPTSISALSLAGGNNGSRTGKTAAQAYVDDILLNQIVFAGGRTYTGSSSFRAIQRATVLSNRAAVNAEFGDLDDGKDGNANPFVTAGLIPEGAPLDAATRESTDPAIQDAAITAAFNSLSLNQGIDGEGADYSLDLIFQQGIIDNNNGSDAAPELVFFERGVNSDFQVQVITGTLANPILSSAVTINRSDLAATGVFINTTEIGSGQQLGAVGIDLNDFGILAGEIVFGVRITSINGSGADLYGNFLSGDPSQFRDIPTGVKVPEPSSLLGLVAFSFVGGWLTKKTKIKS